MIFYSICGYCRHRLDEGDDTEPRCAAFPNGIPDDIRRRGFDHRNPYEGDGGIMFEPDGPVDVARLDRIVARSPLGRSAGGESDD